MNFRFRVETSPERDTETQAINDLVCNVLGSTPGYLRRPPEVIREEQRVGHALFSQPVFSDRARDVVASENGLSVPLRVIEPANGEIRGAILHVHGGGWALGSSDLQDRMLESVADGTGLVCVSVDYRLAPEHPYPAGPDDCEAAALWLAGHAQREFGARKLFIGGDSAGAHLSVSALLRLRDRHCATAFSGACLFYGLYDMGLTPSMRAYRALPLLDRADVENFRAHFLQNGEDLDDPDVSPLYADVAGMPPALFSCGTRDGLVDDSLFMASRWAAAGNEADVVLWPNGPHSFLAMDMALARDSLADAIQWLNGRLSSASDTGSLDT